MSRTRRLALLLLTAVALAVPSCARNPTPATPERHVRPASGSVTLPPGYTPSEHFLQRMAERGVSEAEVADAIQNGQRFYDPKNDSYIRWKDGVYIALTKSGVAKTVIRGPIERRWVPQ